MMMFVPPPLQDSRFFFAGGTADQLARALARKGVAPAAVFADAHYRFRSVLAIERSALSPRALAKEIDGMAQGETYGIAAKELPPGFLVRLGYADYEDSIVGRARLAVENGKVVVDGSKSVWVKVDDLLGLRLQRPVACHWLYRSAYVAITPGSFDEALLLRAISDAVGAKWSNSAQGYRIEFDPASHRARSIATYNSARWKLPYGELPGRKRVFALAAEQVKDETWRKAFAAPNGSAIEPGIDPRSKVAVAGEALLKDLALNARRTRQEESYRVLSGLFAQIDHEKPARIEIRADGRLSVDFPFFDGKTWTGV